jgi:hypothetical protein
MKTYTLDEWIIFGHTGRSSKTMWAALKDLPTLKYCGRGGYLDIPYDYADFSRCYGLYKSCQLTETDLQKVATVLPWFAPFIKHWHELTTELLNQTFNRELMQQVRDKSDALYKHDTTNDAFTIEVTI